MNNPRLNYLLYDRSEDPANQLPNRDQMLRPGRKERRDVVEPLIVSNEEQRSSPVRVLSYVFTGKLTLFPVVIICLGFGAGYLLFYGNKSYSGDYFKSTEVYYGAAGLVASLVALTLFFFLVTWMVLRISFVITPTTFRILKSGILRSSQLEFDISKTSLHYFRTHYNEDRSWLQLVVKEDEHYYQIFSWKGAGKQKDRFLELFKTLRHEIRIAQGNRPRAVETNSVIVSREEFTVIGPFAARRRRLVGRQKDDPETKEQSHPVCIEDLPVVSYDAFFQHFSNDKRLADSEALRYM
jgi:hypothetical protein